MIYLVSTRKVNGENGGYMNDKFFDLKKEKQDRMINAALKVFAGNGYEHASTDEIVKEAGISKGLLFHYFISKIGLYTFVYDYSVKYLLLELNTGVDKEETDFFKLTRQIKNCELQVMRTYPYLIRFLSESGREQNSEALEATREKRVYLGKQYDRLVERAEDTPLRDGVSMDQLKKMVQLTLDGLMAEAFFEGSFQPERYMEDALGYLLLLERLCVREA